MPENQIMEIKFRQATVKDIKAIQEIEKEYYEGFSADEKILKSWIETLPENFILAEDNKSKMVGFIFVEYLEKPQALPFIHDVNKTHKKNGRYFYVSEVGVLDEFGIGLMQTLFREAADKARQDGVKFAVWLTGERSKHDKMELEVLEREGFKRKEQVKNWEAYPGYFVSDHQIWVKKI